MLSDAQVKGLWDKANPFPEWESWQKDYRELLAKVRPWRGRPGSGRPSNGPRGRCTR